MAKPKVLTVEEIFKERIELMTELEEVKRTKDQTCSCCDRARDLLATLDARDERVKELEGRNIELKDKMREYDTAFDVWEELCNTREKRISELEEGLREIIRDYPDNTVNLANKLLEGE